jgi:hypothetical protein
MLRTKSNLTRTRLEEAALTTQFVTDAIAQAIAGLRTDLPNIVATTVNPLIEPLRQAPPVQQQTQQTQQTQLDPAVARQIHNLTEENKVFKQSLTDLQTREKQANERAEKSDRENQIRTAMNTFAFAGDNARDAAYRLLELDIQRAESGELVGPGNLPLVDYVKDALTKKHDYLLAPPDVSGAGAARGTTRQISSVGLETIKPDMTTSDRADVVREIQRVLTPAA